MSRMKKLSCFCLGLSVVVFTAPSAAEIVYQNSDLGTRGFDHSFASPEGGDQITLAGNCRVISELELGIANIAVGSNPQVVVRMYANDGAPSPDPAAGNEPGTLLFQSGPIIVQTPSPGFFYTFPVAVPDIVVPDTFTWTIERVGGGSLQLARFGPPSIGLTSDFIWTHNAPNWTPQSFSNVLSNGFYAIVTASGGPASLTCPTDAVVECGGDTSPATTGEATAQGCGPVNVTFADSTLPGCGGTGSVMRTWTADDGSGTPVSCVQMIDVVDTTPPVLAGIPLGLTTECDSVPVPATPVATDSCDPAVSVVFGEVASGTCGNTTITRTWTATDVCGNTAIASQQIQVRDTTAPVSTADLILIASGDEEGKPNDDDEGVFTIIAACSDNCSGFTGCGAATVAAELRCARGGVVAVTPGEVVEIEVDDESCEIEIEDGMIEIEGEVTLVVTCTDASGNASQATAIPIGLALDNDDETEDDD